MNLFPFLVFLNATAFIIYGFSCLYSDKMKVEFARFRLSKAQRLLTGYLQILASTGLLLGYFYFPLLLTISAIGLSAQMLAGFSVRLWIRDSIAQSFPAFFFMLLNGLIVYQSVVLLN